MGIAGANLGAAAFTGAPEQVEASAVGASVGVHHPCQWWSERRVLFLADQHFRPRPRPGRSVRKPFPDWVDYTPHSIWIYDTTPFPAAGMAVLALEDLVSRKWITEIVSVEETSTQLQLGFTNALTAEGLLDLATTRQDRPLDPTVDDPTRPILLAVSDHGPQRTSGSTREFLALRAIAQHYGRPGTPTDQTWIESLVGHIKADYPPLLAIHDPNTLPHELTHVREHYNTLRLHAGIGYLTPQRRTPPTRRNHPQNPRSRTRTRPPTPACPAPPAPARSTRPGTRRCWLTERDLLSQSQIHVRATLDPGDLCDP